MISCCSWQETQDELDEFQISSRELEAELETQLEQLEIQTRDLQAALIKLEQENELLKVCMRPMYVRVEVCICDNLYVYACVSMYVSVYGCVLDVQCSKLLSIHYKGMCHMEGMCLNMSLCEVV